MPGVTVTVMELATKATRTTVTDERGLFRVAALPPGRYEVRAELTGFRSVNVTEIALLSSEVRDLGRLTLAVGTQTDAITVTAEVTPVQVATSSRASTVTSEQLTNIPMKGRDIYELLAVLPGVQDTNLNRDFTTWTSMRDVTINGAPVTSKNVMVDGISVVDEGGGGNAFVNPNIDAVGEVRVIANGYTAENGRNNGGLINMITKSGTSQFKGSGWYNARRDRWNANDFFRNAQGQPKPLYRVNISGYGIGGPVVIPRLLETGKLFFFVSQEYTDDARPSSVVRANLPTEAERRGDFSQTRQTNGALQVIVDPKTGLPFPGNVIPADRMNRTGRALLNLMPMPNGYVNPQPGQQFTSNFAFDQTPLHSRTNHALRIDTVISPTIRGSFRFLKDREDNWSYSTIAPGLGTLNNAVPGLIYSGSVSKVLGTRAVNEINVGYARNNYGFVAADDFDYRSMYRTVAGIDPPRLNAFGAHTDPPILKEPQVDEWPYLPILSFCANAPTVTNQGNCGTRANMWGYNSMSTGGRAVPTANRNDRWSFQDDLSITMGRHNLKFGVYLEYTLKTEPGSANYMGAYNFGSDATNPLDSGNGFANALLGNFTTYTEISNRVNMDRRHWHNEGYLQDSWRVTSGLTLDYGVRLTHSGPFYEVNDSNAGFFDDLYNRQNAGRLYRPICLDGRPGTQTCPQNLRAAIDPANPGRIFSFAYAGNIVPGSGTQTNGMQTGGVPELGKVGQYYELPYLVAAPRVGFAWDLTGDGKTALRASFGTFYNYPRGGYTFTGAPPVSFNRVIRNASIDELANFSNANLSFAESPINVSIAGGKRDLAKSYNVNVAFQRDIGFNTAVEAAYVGNFTRSDSRTLNLNPIPLYAYSNPANLFNNTGLNANFLRSAYPGMGTVNSTITDVASLNYNSLQLSAQRRLSRGLQMGLAYTLAKGMGWQDFDGYQNYFPEEQWSDRFYGPTDVDRRHNLVVNYSYLLPNPADNVPFVRPLLADWQLSGVTKFLSGVGVTPTCSSNNAGIANTDPSLTGITARCQTIGDPYANFTPGDDPSTAMQFDTAAFVVAQPVSATVGNFGNTPLRILRNPSWSNWDMTLARRIPLQRLNVRLQLQVYNVFNQTEFTEIGATYTFTGANNATNTNTNTGRFTAATPPRQVGLTIRVDF